MVRLICALILVLLVASPSFGQQSLVGTYKMVSSVLNIDGTLTENMGKAPKGYLVVTPTRIVFFLRRKTENSVPPRPIRPPSSTR
jgi:hypothetical protein